MPKLEFILHIRSICSFNLISAVSVIESCELAMVWFKKDPFSNRYSCSGVRCNVCEHRWRIEIFNWPADCDTTEMFRKLKTIVNTKCAKYHEKDGPIVNRRNNPSAYAWTIYSWRACVPCDPGEKFILKCENCNPSYVRKSSGPFWHFCEF